MAPKLRELGICAVAALAAATALPSQASPWSVRNDSRLGYLKTVIDNHYETVYRVPFRGGETARVEVSGDGSSDLDLYIFDENGNQVCKDEDDTDDMSCSWRPRFTGDFFIRISNRGDANAYVLMYN